MMTHIRILAERAWTKYGVRSVVHPHAGGYIEFEDEIKKLMQDIPHEIAGLCLGHRTTLLFKNGLRTLA
ncbi:hypothetical protein NST21_13915 [Peribacillus sp. FSL K6-1552]|uniref:hypothetical protein n=1 Tax=Peribacillus sp. FSL K6-1552 TaxID=2954514 RepID=UPI0030F6EC0E